MTVFYSPLRQRAVEGLPRWMLAASEEDEVRAVRKRRLFRFEDDVTARVYPDPDGTRLELTSASRLGKGDLGQNPRNLTELLRAVDREAGSSGVPPRRQVRAATHERPYLIVPSSGREDGP